ncbi:META domain-containing protein [Marinobacterium arenosum]|uniref:META domain-containing protein n=1 Tax=Marinobacterium arenosum TaxID=2862496 RepID=UPI001C971FD1|nr:META domain-containing protein [Marinobacterium arenosum]MBY4675332.1 META domain-containing protein [Marinobacterium arenosum]
MNLTKIPGALVGALLMLLLPGCAGTVYESGEVKAPAEFAQLPASFTGELPCADCPGIRYRLNLFADHSYFLSRHYLDREPDSTFYELGGWALGADGRQLVLRSEAAEPVRFAVVDADSLRLLDRDGQPIGSELNYSLERTAHFERIEPRLKMRGMYQYLADAAIFTECLSRQRWPVALLADNATLERDYLAQRRQPGEPLLVELDGRLEMRPAMEGDRLLPTLVVEQHRGVWPGESCGSRFATEQLENTYWKLTRLMAKPVAVYGQQREPSLILRPEDRRLAGSGGCNRLIGSYRVEGKEISFALAASTRMVCPQGMDTEQIYMDVLAKVRNWRVVGQHLELYDAEGALLMRFQAIYF